VRKRVGEFFGKTPHTGLNPDEVVAMGAAVQADILTSGRRDMLLLDVVPLSLGIETFGGVVDKLIHRNSTVPARGMTRYTTGVDNQTAILLNIYQGERELTKDCRFLGTFKLSGIPPMPAQFAQVDVTFLVNQDGILTVTAKELRSGAQAQVTVQPAHGLTQDEVDALVNASIEHAHDDFTARRLIELRNKAEGDLRYTEKGLAEAGDKLSAEQRAAIAQTSAALRTAITGSDLAALQAAIKAHVETTNPLATIIMNEVVRKKFTGSGGDVLNPEKL
jgi:molecular chaperone DnaK